MRQHFVKGVQHVAYFQSAFNIVIVAAAAAAAKLLQLYPTLCDPVDHSPPGSPVPGTLQARALEWVPCASGD